MAKPRKPRTARTTRAKAGARAKSAAGKPDTIEDAEIVEEAADSAPTSTSAEKAQASSKDVPDPAGDAAGTSPEAEAEKNLSGSDAPEKPASRITLGPDSGDTASETPEGAEPSDDATPADAKSDEGDDGETTSRATPADAAASGENGREVLPVPPAPAAPPRHGGFLPLFLGGLVAAALGAGALYLSNEQGWIDLGGVNRADLEARLAAQDARAEEMQQALAAAQEDIAGLDLGPLTEGARTLGDAVAGLETRIAELATRLEAVEIRLGEVETQPIPKAELPAEVVAAYEAKLGELQAALDARTAEIEAVLDQRAAGMQAHMEERLAAIEAAQEAAADAERQALETARNAEARAALAEIDAALDAGTGYAEALERLGAASDTEVPEGLSASAASGVPSLSELQASFPDAARAALRASTRAARDEGELDPVSAFFRTQLGARSLEPREGDDPDAVLSRAEDALSRGELDAALAEIEKLPAAGQSAMADWVSRAETRLAARTALAELARQTDSN